MFRIMGHMIHMILPNMTSVLANLSNIVDVSMNKIAFNVNSVCVDDQTAE